MLYTFAIYNRITSLHHFYCGVNRQVLDTVSDSMRLRNYVVLWQFNVTFPFALIATVSFVYWNIGFDNEC